eukprot:UN05138
MIILMKVLPANNNDKPHDTMVRYKNNLIQFGEGWQTHHTKPQYNQEQIESNN